MATKRWRWAGFCFAFLYALTTIPFLLITLPQFLSWKGVLRLHEPWNLSSLFLTLLAIAAWVGLQTIPHAVAPDSARGPLRLMIIQWGMLAAIETFYQNRFVGEQGIGFGFGMYLAAAMVFGVGMVSLLLVLSHRSLTGKKPVSSAALKASHPK